MGVKHLINLNFTNWLKNIKILLKSKRIAYVVEGESSVEHVEHASEDEVWEYKSDKKILLPFNVICLPRHAMNCKGNMRTRNQESYYYI